MSGAIRRAQIKDAVAAPAPWGDAGDAGLPPSRSDVACIRIRAGINAYMVQEAPAAAVFVSSEAAGRGLGARGDAGPPPRPDRRRRGSRHG